MSNLRQIGIALVTYSTRNDGYICPAYNLPLPPGTPPGATGVQNYNATPSQVMEGWPIILDEYGLLSQGANQDINTVLYCQDTVDIFGCGQGQTGTNPGNMMGWTDWPMIFPNGGGDGGVKQGIADPAFGNRILRTSYWMNAYNPIGGQPGNLATADVFYTTSVGVGPDPNGQYCRPHKMSQLAEASLVVVMADGVYMGRQSVTNGESNCRIGYRHRGSANVAFADGHVENILKSGFPESISASDTTTARATKASINLGHCTVYEDTRIAFP
ncbi:MAG TPA: H-X9-DG-CTERM domain-containing protein [Tepidisphaeraceae bacterium]|nr:H-X9-DG-CTERM domain-containing protein [Tepidisphaeraceae bacterium]